MVLFFTALQEQRKIKVFSFKPDQLEFGLDLINIVNAQGNVILSAHFVDTNGATEIPLEVFDGNPFSAPIQSLEKEWKKLLKKPPKQKLIQHTPEHRIDTSIGQIQCEKHLSRCRKEFIASLRKRVQFFEEHIRILGSIINQLEGLIQQAEQFGFGHSAEKYKRLVHKNEVRIAEAQNKLKLLSNNIHQLEYE